MGVFKALIFTLIATSLLGCTMEASLEKLGESISAPVVMNKGQLTGFVSGSTGSAPTSGGYAVDSATGNYTNKIAATTNGGYKVFISVQGNIVSN